MERPNAWKSYDQDELENLNRFAQIIARLSAKIKLNASVRKPQ